MNFFTSLEYVNGQYQGVVYRSGNNALLYRSQSYPTQQEAMSDVSTYLLKNNQQISQPQAATPNISVSQIPAAPPRKCCGR
jgi:hypothetical protein